MKSSPDRKAVIMQPTYLPWLGYFDLIDQTDIFVFLDNVQFQKQSWQQRNQIRSNEGLEWITVPVRIKKRFGQLIRDVEINPVKFPEKQIKKIHQHYSRASYFNDYYEEFSGVLTDAVKNLSLCDLNITMIEWFCSKLSLSSDFIRSSELKAEGKRAELLVNILGELDIDTYISPIGSLEYIKDDINYFQDNKITVLFSNYVHPEYNQIYKPFIEYASIIDLLMNEGDGSAEILRSGRREPTHISKLVS